jgi:hypothetical protein
MPKTRESCNRHEIILPETSERANTGERSGLRACSRLVFCNDLRHIRHFEVEKWGSCTFPIQDEQEMTHEMAKLAS